MLRRLVVALYARPQSSSGHVASLASATRRAVSNSGSSVVVVADEGGRRPRGVERRDNEWRLARLPIERREPSRLACKRLKLSLLPLS